MSLPKEAILTRYFRNIAVKIRRKETEEYGKEKGFEDAVEEGEDPRAILNLFIEEGLSADDFNTYWSGMEKPICYILVAITKILCGPAGNVPDLPVERFTSYVKSFFEEADNDSKQKAIYEVFEFFETWEFPPYNGDPEVGIFFYTLITNIINSVFLENDDIFKSFVGCFTRIFAYYPELPLENLYIKFIGSIFSDPEIPYDDPVHLLLFFSNQFPPTKFLFDYRLQLIVTQERLVYQVLDYSRSLLAQHEDGSYFEEFKGFMNIVFTLIQWGFIENDEIFQYVTCLTLTVLESESFESGSFELKELFLHYINFLAINSGKMVALFPNDSLFDGFITIFENLYNQIDFIKMIDDFVIAALNTYERTENELILDFSRMFCENIFEVKEFTEEEDDERNRMNSAFADYKGET